MRLKEKLFFHLLKGETYQYLGENMHLMTIIVKPIVKPFNYQIIFIVEWLLSLVIILMKLIVYKI